MAIDRRKFLKVSVATAGACVAGLPTTVSAAKNVQTDIGDTFSMLNDSTKCVGCRACQIACKERQGYGPDGDDPRWDMPTELSSKNLTLIKLAKDGDKYSFVKRQCMHCYEPACVSACLVSALQKNVNGVVSYNKKKCIGCRYCMIACPFSVPAYEYDSSDPYVIKCDFCQDIITEGGIPKCANACPAGAIKFGKRDELLAEARERIEKHPDRYINHIYGEKEAGGTSVLYLAGMEFNKLGLSNVGYEKYPSFTKGFLSAVPLVLTVWPMLLMGAYAFSKKEVPSQKSSEEG